MKELVTGLAIILTFVGYVPYVRDTLAGKTTPHVYTWLIWGFVTLIAFGLQVGGGAGAGALVALTSGSLALFVAVLGFRVAKGSQNLDKINTSCFIWLLCRY